MVTRREALGIYRDICEKERWEEDLGMSKEAAQELGIRVLDYIQQREAKEREFGKRRRALWHQRRKYQPQPPGGWSYGGTQATNYQLRQMATYQGTPSLEQLWRAGSEF